MTVLRYVAAAALLALAAPAAARAADPACGATITTSTRLHADLTNCPGDGLVIGADHITLDLGRHTLDGAGAGTGIVLNGHRGVTVTGGTVQEFGTGIGMDNADGNRIRALTIRAIGGRGVDATDGSDGNVFEFVTSSGNRTGIAITSSTADTIRASTLSDNDATGALVFTATHTLVEGNRIAGNAFNGIAFVEGSSDNRALANDVRGSETGLIIDTSNRNVFAFNHVTGGGDGILVAGDANAVTGNAVERSVGGCEGCSGWGIGVTAGAGNLVKANLVQRSASDGINVAAAGTVLARNGAFNNAGLGINALPGARDGGGNRAAGNAPPQCVNVSCRSGRTARWGRDRTRPRSAHRSGGGRRGHR